MKFIKQYPNQLPDELCDRFIQLFEDNEHYHAAGLSGLQYGEVNLENKDSTDLDLQKGQDIAGWDKELLDTFEPYLMDALAKYISETHPASDGTLPSWSEEQVRSAWYMTQAPRMMRYYPGQGFHAWHCDRDAETPREIVIMVYLNDCPEGGETAFFHQGIKIKSKKGNMVLFPAGFTHHHRGESPVSGVRYVINLNVGRR